MTKSVTFNPSPRKKPDPADLDAFVQGRGGEGARTEPEPAPHPPVPKPKAPMKRLTFDIPADLHRRIRIACVEQGIDMAEDLRRILAEHYPPKM